MIPAVVEQSEQMGAQADAVVGGDMLSCFTASISQYMASQSIDWDLVLGTQLFLAVHPDPEPGVAIGVAHYHTPLRGRESPLGLERRRTTDPSAAVAAILDECRRRGAVIVVGDAGRLPWMAGFGAKHVPHWFVIDETTSPDPSSRGGAVHVTDRFEFTDEQGTQSPFSGWIDIEQLRDMICIVPDWPAVYRWRERWAFGFEEKGIESSEGICAWYEAAHSSPSLQGGGWGVGRLRDSVAYHAGDRRPDAFGPGWHCGLDAVRMLPALFEARLSDPDLYAASDDIWVVARTRLLFGRAVERIGTETGSDALCALARFAVDEVAAQWLALPRIMHYNVSCLDRGRTPRALLVDVMNQVVSLEEQLVSKLTDALDMI